MKINTEIDGKSITITLTDEQLKEIQSQLPVKKWQDKLVQPEKKEHFYISDIFSEHKLNVCQDFQVNRKPELAFKTKKQAQLLADKCNLMIEMHNYALAVNDGWVPDWTDNTQVKFGISYYDKNFEIETYSKTNSFIFGICVKSNELAQEMLDEFGVRLEELYNQQY